MSSYFRDYGVDSILEDSEFLDNHELDLEMFSDAWWNITLTHLLYVSIPIIILYNLSLFNMVLWVFLFNFHEVVGIEEEDEDALDFFEALEEPIPTFSNVHLEVKGMELSGSGPISSDAFKERLNFLEDEGDTSPHTLIYRTLRSYKDQYKDDLLQYPRTIVDRLYGYTTGTHLIKFYYGLIATKSELLDTYYSESQGKLIPTVKEDPELSKFYNHSEFAESLKKEIPFDQKRSFFLDTVQTTIKDSTYIAVDKDTFEEVDSYNKDRLDDTLLLKDYTIFNLHSMGYYHNTSYDYHCFLNQLKESEHIQESYYNNQNKLIVIHGINPSKDKEDSSLDD